MRAKVAKWGNSLGVRIPKVLASQAGLKLNSSVEVTLEQGRIVVEPVRAATVALARLLERITPETLHQEIPTGPARGSEEW
jgi:antitoxin MazE